MDRKDSFIMLIYLFVTVVSFYTVSEFIGINTSPAYQYSTYVKEIIIALTPLAITLAFPLIRKMFLRSFLASPILNKVTWFYIMGFFLLQYLTMKITYDYGILISESWRVFYNLDFPYITHFQYPVIGFTLYILSRVVLVPVIEEFFYRVFLIIFFRKWMNIWIAVLLQTVLFAAMHPFSPFSACIFGLLLGILYVRTKSILPGLILHAIWNLYSALIMNFDIWFIPRW